MAYALLVLMIGGATSAISGQPAGLRPASSPGTLACPVPGLNVGVLPFTANLTVGQSRQFEAIVYCGQQNVTDSANISWSVTGGIGRVSPTAGKITSFLAQASGTGTVVATAEYQGETGQRAANVGVTGGAVCNQPLNVQVNPHQANMQVGEARQFAASVQCGPDDVTSASSIAWHVTGGIGNVTPNTGITTTFIADTVGSGRVVANASYQSNVGEGFATVTVTGGGNITPTVVMTVPINGSVGVPTNQIISISFNTPMDTAATQAAITAAPAITGAFSWSMGDTSVSWTPAAPLASATTYHVNVGTGAKSKPGVPMAAPEDFAFTTAAGGGGAPSVVATAPANNQQNVPVTSPIGMSFSMAMNRSATEGAVTASPAVAGAVTWAAGDTVFGLTPSPSLAYNTTYTVTVSAAAKSAAGTAMASPYSWQFKTEALPGPPAPRVTATDPADKSTGIALSADVRVTFDLEMDRTATESAFSITPTPAGSFAWNAGGTQLTFNPTSDLAYSTTYTTGVGIGARSKAGVALAAATSSKFTTVSAPVDSVPPTIVHQPVASWDAGVDLPISANVTDNVGVKPEGVSLNFRVGGGWGSEPPLEMKRVGTTDEYRATIPGTKVAGASLEYYIWAGDAAGNNATHPAGAPGAVHLVIIKTPGGGTGGTLSGGGLLLPLLGVAVAAVVAALLVFMFLKRKKSLKAREQQNESMTANRESAPQQGSP